MTQADKELLLKDLCARLSYGVKIFYEMTNEIGNTHTYDGYILYELSNDGQHITLLNCDDKHGVCEVDMECGNFKPYLRPMSSMTEEEKEEKFQMWAWKSCDWEVVDWLNKHHFDYRELIRKGLALKAPEGMYNLEKK